MNINTKKDRLFKFLKWFYEWEHYEYPKTRCSYFWLTVYAGIGIPLIPITYVSDKSIKKIIPDIKGTTKALYYIPLLFIMFIYALVGLENEYYNFIISYIIIGIGLCIAPFLIKSICIFTNKIGNILLNGTIVFPRRFEQKESLVIGYLKDVKNKHLTN